MAMNKRGAELTIGTIIIIILAVIVLVFLIYGFTVGWGNLFDKIGNFGGGQSNVDTVVQACEIACTTQSQFDYCELMREVNAGDVGTKISQDTDGDGEVKATCKALESESVGLDRCQPFDTSACMTKNVVDI